MSKDIFTCLGDNIKIEISKKDLKELKNLYNKSKPNEVFLFKGQQFLREYAKYFIEYIEGKLK